jgi:hypothetical protein
MTQRLDTIAARTGCTNYEIIRDKNHVIVDFITDRGTRVRITISKSTSDDARALKNQIADVRRLLKQKGV